MEAPSYEFTESQNETLKLLGSRMRWVGIFFMAIGVACGAVGAVSLVQSGWAFELMTRAIILIMIAAIFVLTGIWTVDAAKSFTLIVKTAGSDIQNLMHALGDLLKLYYMQFWLIIDSLVVFVVAIAVLIGIGAF